MIGGVGGAPSSYSIYMQQHRALAQADIGSHVPDTCTLRSEGLPLQSRAHWDALALIPRTLVTRQPTCHWSVLTVILATYCHLDRIQWPDFRRNLTGPQRHLRLNRHTSANKKVPTAAEALKAAILHQIARSWGWLRR